MSAGFGNPFAWGAEKAASIANKDRATEVEKKFLPFAKKTVSTGIFTPGRMFKYSSKYRSGYYNGIIRGMQENATARNQNLSSTQHNMPKQVQPAQDHEQPGKLNIKLNPKQESEQQEKPMKSKEAFSKPESSKTEKGVPVLGDKGMRRGVKNQKGQSKPKPQKGPGGPKKMRGGPKK